MCGLAQQLPVYQDLMPKIFLPLVVVSLGLVFIYIPLVRVSDFGRSAQSGTHPDVKCDRSVDIAIVGAGIAGTYFAYKLRDTGLAIELLEYSDRIGGRLFTTSLPNIPDINLEMGGMRYHEGKHAKLSQLVQELNLTPVVFGKGSLRPENAKYFVRGKILTQQDIQNGDVPYRLSREEKANAGKLNLYYLNKLNVFNNSVHDEDIVNIQVKDGRDLSQLTMNEALGMVATSEGKQFIMDTDSFLSDYMNDTTAIQYFMELLEIVNFQGRILTVDEGMSSIPKTLVNVFLNSSHRHKITLNRKLVKLTHTKTGLYQLLLKGTATIDGFTLENITRENICAKKVALAIPQFALRQLKWKPLRFANVTKALSAVTQSTTSKVFLTFPTAWWLNSTVNATVMTSDLPFALQFDWGSSNISGDSVMLASYTDSHRSLQLQNINSEYSLASGSATGYNKVTKFLKDKLLWQLCQAYKSNRSLIPEPSSAISQFWTTYPFGGGWTVWRAGSNFSYVRQIIRRPSLKDDVYIVGSDYASVGYTIWSEGALRTVDEVFDKYFNELI